MSKVRLKSHVTVHYRHLCWKLRGSLLLRVSLISFASSTFLVTVLSSPPALPARKQFFRHWTDNSGPVTGSRLEAPVMGPEGGKEVGALGTTGSMESAQHSPTLASGPAPSISHSSETDGH